MQFEGAWPHRARACPLLGIGHRLAPWAPNGRSDLGARPLPNCGEADRAGL